MKKLFFTCIFILSLCVGRAEAQCSIALTSNTGSDAQTVCLNTAITDITYATVVATGATFTGLPTGVTGIWSTDVVTISGTPSESGSFPYTITLTGGGCSSITAAGIITVTADNTIILSSAAGTNSQTVCTNTAITNITYATTGATGANVTGLPTGVNGNWASNVVTISGTPSVTGSFPYTVSLTGGCGSGSASGTITVTGSSTINLSSAAGTNSQTVCANTAITNITYATTGATGANVTGLPTGVNGNWASNVVTISGTPSVSGVFNYIVTLTGGCGSITSNSTLSVNPTPIPTLTSSAPGDVSCAGTNVTFTAGGGTTYSFRIGGVIKQTGASNIYTTNTLTNGNLVDVVVTNAAGCSATYAPPIQNFVNPPPFIFISTPANCSIDLVLLFFLL